MGRREHESRHGSVGEVGIMDNDLIFFQSMKSFTFAFSVCREKGPQWPVWSLNGGKPGRATNFLLTEKRLAHSNHK